MYSYPIELKRHFHNNMYQMTGKLTLLKKSMTSKSLALSSLLTSEYVSLMMAKNMLNSTKKTNMMYRMKYSGPKVE